MRSFGVLKSRFRCIDTCGGTLFYSPSRACRITVASVVLHNMCIANGVPLPTDCKFPWQRTNWTPPLYWFLKRWRDNEKQTNQRKVFPIITFMSKNILNVLGLSQTTVFWENFKLYFILDSYIENDKHFPQDILFGVSECYPHASMIYLVLLLFNLKVRFFNFQKFPLNLKFSLSIPTTSSWTFSSCPPYMSSDNFLHMEDLLLSSSENNNFMK